MHPIEFQHSIARLDPAQEVQLRATHDPSNATSEETIKQVQEESKLKETTIKEFDANEAINPDEQKKQETQEKEKKKNLPQEGLPGPLENIDPDPDKGNTLDIIA